MLIFFDEATFQINGKMNRHNCRIWGTQNPHDIVEHKRDSPKVNVFCAMSCRKLYGSFFFEESTVTGQSFLAMLLNWLMPLLKNDSDNFVLQLDRIPPHFHRFVRTYLNTELSNRLIGRGGATDQCVLKWPPRSSDITTCDFFCGVMWRTLYTSLSSMWSCGTQMENCRGNSHSLGDMLDCVWQEFDYRVDICRITRLPHRKFVKWMICKKLTSLLPETMHFPTLHGQ